MYAQPDIFSAINLLQRLQVYLLTPRSSTLERHFIWLVIHLDLVAIILCSPPGLYTRLKTLYCLLLVVVPSWPSSFSYSKCLSCSMFDHESFVNYSVNWHVSCSLFFATSCIIQDPQGMFVRTSHRRDGPYHMDHLTLPLPTSVVATSAFLEYGCTTFPIWHMAWAIGSYIPFKYSIIIFVWNCRKLFYKVP